MKILAIETSCDETAIAIIDITGPKNKPVIKILSNIISSQIKLHAKFGGVVPNLAKREHQKNLPIILRKALKESRLLKISKQNINPKLEILDEIFGHELELLKKFKKDIVKISAPDIDAIAVTIGPGLAPALWVGVNFARALSYTWNKPFIPINHMEGHIYSVLCETKRNKSQTTNSKLQSTKILKFPALALLVSGGHTELVLIKDFGKYRIIGETVDDAAGEAFDKVARLLKLGYPGGPVLSKLAEKGNPKNYPLPRPMINSGDYNFSFSGLKTAVLYLLRGNPKAVKKDIAASFQEAVIEVLTQKTIRAAKEYKIKTVILGGGVSANKQLRKTLSKKVSEELKNVEYKVAPVSISGDNALMIALAAFFTGQKKNWKKAKAEANLQLGN